MRFWSIRPSALRPQDFSHPLCSWKLLDFTSTPSSLRAAAFQSLSGEINIDLSSCGESIKRVLIDSTCCITLMFKVKYS